MLSDDKRPLAEVVCLTVYYHFPRLFSPESGDPSYLSILFAGFVHVRLVRGRRKGLE